MAALLRRRLADLTGLPETELRDLLRPQGHERQPAHAAPPPEGRPRERAGSGRFGQRGAPSLVRELIQALLLQPDLAHSVVVPRPADGTSEGVALAALVEFCTDCEHPLTTPGVFQHFVGTPHERVLSKALATAEDHGITAEQAAQHLVAGVARYWSQAQLAGRPVAADANAADAKPEDAERLRQLEIVRRASAPASHQAPDRSRS
jgi:hypothetical protein